MSILLEKSGIKYGSCNENLCENPETVCVDFSLTTHVCVCKNDKCHPEEMESINVQSKDDLIIINVITVAILGTAVTILLLLCICCNQLLIGCSDKSQVPRSLPDEPLVSNEYSALGVNEYFAMNEEYFNNALMKSADAMDPASITYLKKCCISSMKEIGQGCFGKVYKALLTHADGEIETVAIKMLKDHFNAVAREDFMREVGIMANFKHPNILTLIGVCPPDASLNFEGVSSPWMVFEYMEYGDLTEVLRNSNEVFSNNSTDLPVVSQDALLDISLQIAAGMEYLASQRFVHRDLACRNCLVGHDMNVKIADFGMSRDIYSCDYYQANGSRLLPLRWMSPESIEYRKFTMESDVWSFGVVLWEIFSLGKTPYYEYSNDAVLKLIPQGKLLEKPKDCPAVISKLMEDCWKFNPKSRIGFVDIHERLKNAFKGHGSNDSAHKPPALQVINIELLKNHPILNRKNEDAAHKPPALQVINIELLKNHPILDRKNEDAAHKPPALQVINIELLKNHPILNRKNEDTEADDEL